MKSTMHGGARAETQWHRSNTDIDLPKLGKLVAIVHTTDSASHLRVMGRLSTPRWHFEVGWSPQFDDLCVK